MTTVSKNDYYEHAYDPEKNLVYWTMKGFWMSMSVVPNYDSDWDKILQMTKPGF